ncbi:hypothetical protein BJ138DRAFT_1052384 [Hygrophoropsis aurantiaca]|uniref:Uncharacterized protein n=1 Tax=Hygrophoropsis aurantiaca TaxID=72124 RepID=A0ACB8ATH9_9AGAM|nr:hypothetical protein BJ138DRAFT_1052384 [Hygrophoropsis aurantiaca]
MTQFTTTSATYILGKYSRSYPSSTQPATQSQTAADSDWQHFVNPIIKLLLDAKKSPNGDLVSVRLRIVWLMSGATDEMDVDQREVIFEDMDLLSFSSLPTFNSHPSQPDHGLPLKAVYRDAVVGIRYLHPKLYRRFQITFKSPFSAEQFIDAIRNVCPCKANPPPQIVNRQPTMPPPNHLMRNESHLSAHRNSRFPLPPTQIRSIIPPDVVANAPSDFRISSSVTSTPSRPSLLDSSSPPRAPFARTSSPIGCQHTDSDAPANGPTNTPKTRIQQKPSQKPKHLNSCDSGKSSLPDSSQVSSSNRSDSSMMPPPPPPPSNVPLPAVSLAAPARSQTQDTQSQVIASLRETPSLYNLSRTELEALVSQVVREEGFPKLLDALDSMWTVKGFLAR